MNAKEEAREAVRQTLREVHSQAPSSMFINALRDRGFKVVKMQPKEMATHCPNGHEYTDDNVYWHEGRKRCLTCRRERMRDARHT